MDLAVPLGIRKSFALQHGLSSIQNQRDVQSCEGWHPWPAHPPFADEVTRWWPSDEKPPLTRESSWAYFADSCRSSNRDYIPVPLIGGLLNLTA